MLYHPACVSSGLRYRSNPIGCQDTKILSSNVTICQYFLSAEDPGAPGQIDDTYLRLSGLSKNANSKYPLALLKMMKRYAEDRIWANDIEEGKSVLKFLITLMEGRKGIKAMKKGEFSKGAT